MCGIFGYFNKNGFDSKNCYITDAIQSIRHRGPDDEGLVFFKKSGDIINQYGGSDTPDVVYKSELFYTPMEPCRGQSHPNATMVLGHRRLSIIDLSASGHQPMCTPNKRYWIVYNGEIYNYLELKEELVHLGHIFQSHSDTEVILQSYNEWGERALERFIGMFSLAVYDRIKNRLFLARDFFGIKPLYYTMWDGGFAFSSEIKALLFLPEVSRRANPQRVYDYLRFAHTDHGQETMFSNILQLPAAHFMSISLYDHSPATKPIRYWNISPNLNDNISFEEATNEVRRLFLRNIELHLRSDVPVGSALSGGIDSSSIVMAIRRLLGKNKDLHSFSYIAEDPMLSEEKWINIIGKAVGALMHKTRPSSHDLIDDLDALISIQDEPFESSSIYAQFCVMRLVSENGIKVILDGQGADEFLGGYPGHWGARLASILHKFRLLNALRFYARITRNKNESRVTPILRAGNYFLPTRLKPLGYKTVRRELTPAWLNKNWFKKREVEFLPDRTKPFGNIFRSELLRSLLHEGLISLLRYEDRNSMAFSIESRVPFLTPDLVNFVLSLPEKYIIDLNGRSKCVFREAMNGIVPREILSREDKVGFTTTEKKWLLSLKSHVRSIFQNPIAMDIPVIDVHFLSKKWIQLSGRSQPLNSIAWRCINFIKWCELKQVQFS